MGTITRIIGGKSKWFSKNQMEIIATEKDVMLSSQKRIILDGKEQGISMGQYNYTEKLDFPSGWWSYDYKGEKIIKENKTNLDKVVYFQLNVDDDVPDNTEIIFHLYNREYFLWMDRAKPDSNDFNEKEVIKKGTVRKVGEKKRITIELFLDILWKKKMKEKDMGYLDLHWRWEYKNEDWICANELHLKVFSSRRNLFLKPAHSGYNFPEIRTSDGDIIVFSAGVGFEGKNSPKIERVLGEIQDVVKDEALDKLGKYSDKLRHTIAVRQLRKGKLVNNSGGIEFSRRIYTQPIYDNRGEMYTVTKAANFGYRKQGQVVTTKGISQLDYFKDVGALNKVAKASKELLKVFDFVDLFQYMSGERPETIPIPFLPLDFIVKVITPYMSDQITEMIDDVINEMVEAAKDKGLETVEKIKFTQGGSMKRYDTTEIDQESLNKLFKNEIETLNDLVALNRNPNPKQYVILHYREKNDELDELHDIIDSIFIK